MTRKNGLGLEASGLGHGQAGENLTLGMDKPQTSSPQAVLHYFFFSKSKAAEFMQ